MPEITPEALSSRSKKNTLRISRPSPRVSAALPLCVVSGQNGVLLVSYEGYSLPWVEFTAVRWAEKTLVQWKTDPLLPSWAVPSVPHRAQ